MNIFQKASKLKLRFKTQWGNLAVEDLWDLPLQALDNVAKALNKAVKENKEESFIAPQDTVNKALELQLNIVKDIIAARLADIEANQKAAKNKAKKEKIMRIIAAKDEKALEASSMADLRNMLNEL